MRSRHRHRTTHWTMSRTLLIANPSADVYGSDLQKLESVTAASTTVGGHGDHPDRRSPRRSWKIVERAFVSSTTRSFGVRTPRFEGMAALGTRASVGLRTARRLHSRSWTSTSCTSTRSRSRGGRSLPSSRGDRRWCTCTKQRAPIPERFGLRCTDRCWVDRAIMNTGTTSQVATESAPFLHRRSSVIPNGVPAPESVTPISDASPPVRLACAGRLSPPQRHRRRARSGGDPACPGA